MTRTSFSLQALVWPIFFENIIRTSLMTVDQLMLYASSEEAAAAMSTVNQMSFFIQILYQMVAVGSSILIAQNLGAGRKEAAGRTGLASLVMICGVAVVVSLTLGTLVPIVLGMYTLEPIVREYATSFLVIYASCSIFMAINIAQSSILRAYGHVRDPMYVNIIALFLTIIGNAIALFGPFGLPVFGIAGVAVSTVFSQFVAAILSFFQLRRRRAEILIRYRDVRHLTKADYAGILAIGVPTAGENLSYNMAQILIVGFVSRLGTAALAAWGLVITLSRYVFISGISIGQGTQIKVGHLVGAKKHEEAYHSVWRYSAVGIGISTAAILALNVFKGPLLGLFTDDMAILGIAGATLLVGILLEPVRNLNVIVIPALKAAGDVRFPVGMALFSMWAIGVFGAWFFGLKLGMGLAGIYLGMALDEWFRGISMVFRWKSGAWRKKTLIS